jgi:hypothetical protein
LFSLQIGLTQVLPEAAWYPVESTEPATAVLPAQASFTE